MLRDLHRHPCLRWQKIPATGRQSYIGVNSCQHKSTQLHRIRASQPADTSRRRCTKSGRHLVLTPLDAVAPSQGISSRRTQLQQLTTPAPRPGSSPGGRHKSCPGLPGTGMIEKTSVAKGKRRDGILSKGFFDGRERHAAGRIRSTNLLKSAKTQKGEIEPGNFEPNRLKNKIFGKNSILWYHIVQHWSHGFILMHHYPVRPRYVSATQLVLEIDEGFLLNIAHKSFSQCSQHVLKAGRISADERPSVLPGNCYSRHYWMTRSLVSPECLLSAERAAYCRIHAVVPCRSIRSEPEIAVVNCDGNQVAFRPTANEMHLHDPDCARSASQSWNGLIIAVRPFQRFPFLSHAGQLLRGSKQGTVSTVISINRLNNAII
ncbi:unnamed protein product [Nesidiocoris tenuis]|uniref:Uncharacterized protein n=1 Tax=Nesidiocoris tenuis TaxID=355587 RepID=A0A6H5GVZ7_9HEMI|nr:unnamed protein product [Nesidiocoris tenuis]